MRFDRYGNRIIACVYTVQAEIFFCSCTKRLCALSEKSFPVTVINIAFECDNHLAVKLFKPYMMLLLIIICRAERREEKRDKKNCLVILIYARATSKQSVNMNINCRLIYAHAGSGECVRINFSKR